MLDNLSTAIMMIFIPTATALVVYLTKSFNARMDKEAKDRQAQTILILSMLKVLAENNQELFEALETGRTNGNLARARDRLDSTLRGLDSHLIEKASREE